jgi:hypothetical protein
MCISIAAFPRFQASHFELIFHAGTENVSILPENPIVYCVPSQNPVVRKCTNIIAGSVPAYIMSK